MLGHGAFFCDNCVADSRGAFSTLVLQVKKQLESLKGRMEGLWEDYIGAESSSLEGTVLLLRGSRNSLKQDLLPNQSPGDLNIGSANELEQSLALYRNRPDFSVALQQLGGISYIQVSLQVL